MYRSPGCGADEFSKTFELILPKVISENKKATLTGELNFDQMHYDVHIRLIHLLKI